MRAQVVELVKMGKFPECMSASLELVNKYEELLRSIKGPVTDDEARALIGLFGEDDFFGGAWAVLTLIETAPGWPLPDCLQTVDNEWVSFLRDRAIRGGRLKESAQ